MSNASAVRAVYRGVLRAVLPLTALCLLSCGSAPSAEAPAARLAAPVPAEPAPAEPAAAPAALPDPRQLDAVLATHVRGGRVDYAALKADARARRQLASFLSAVAAMPEDAPLSAWLNAYNALVIQLVLERYPIASVKDVPGFFTELKRPVAGKARSLDEVEHGVIRERFADARVHVALNCGAVSCPALRDRAFREATLDVDLDALARATVADPAHVRRKGGKLLLSAIFFWFEPDFVRDAGSVVAWIERYGGPAGLGDLPAGIERVQREYDWALNDARADGK